MSMHQDHLPPLQDPAFLEMMDLFTEKNYWQRLRVMFAGIGKPRDSREYRLAKTELQRQAAPLAAIVLPSLCVLLLALFADAKVTEDRVIETDIMEAEELEELEEILDKEIIPDDVQPTDIVFTPEIAMSTPAPTPDAPMSPQPQAFDAVMQVKSPVILRNIYGSTRSAGMRGQLISGGGGNAQTEAAVMRALRWLKKNQDGNGSWKSNRNAMTALAILCFLAHGEQPGSSEEFGDNVQRGIEFLLASQPKSGQWPGNYEHYIVTYALSEAYGLTMNPNVKAAVERAVQLILEGQHETGGWDYQLKLGDRDDTSVMGWAAQALKAAKMAGFFSDPAALAKACKLAVKGFQKNAHPDGGFGYISPARGGLSGVGTLCMQFHEAGNFPEVRKTLELMNGWKPLWVGSRPGQRLKDGEKPANAGAPGVPGGGSPQYYYYYATQAKFQAGGPEWKRWNEEMWPEYVKAQFIEEKAIADPKGELQDIGWWENADLHSDRPVLDTCLAALQLMVYYRYLPTFKAVNIPDEVDVSTGDSQDIEVEVNL